MNRRKFNIACLSIITLFLIESLALIYNSAIGIQFGNKNVEFYSYEAKSQLDKSNVIPGDIFDRNKNVIVSFLDEGQFEMGHYADEFSKQLYCNTVGYSRANTGYGIIYKYQPILSLTQKDTDTKGYSLYLTLDHNLQLETYNVLSECIGEGNEGAMVIMDADTGELLSCVSLPLFDVTDIPSEEDGEEISPYLFQPLANYAMKAPGSIFKSLSAITMLENGLEDTWLEDDTVYYGNGYEIHNYDGYPVDVDSINYREALRKSSNVFFINALSEVDNVEQMLTDVVKRVGIGENFELDFASNMYSTWTFDESTIKKIKDNNPNMDMKRELVNTVFGQSETRFSTIQAAMITAGLINDGNIMTPYMIKEVRNPNGGVVQLSNLVKKLNKEYELISRSNAAKKISEESGISSVIPEPTVESGKVFSRLTSPDIAASILEAMQYAATEEYQFDENLGVAAKSGTAQDGQDAEYEHAWMISCANINGHNYSIAMTWLYSQGQASHAKEKDAIQSMYYYLSDYPIEKNSP